MKNFVKYFSCRLIIFLLFYFITLSCLQSQIVFDTINSKFRGFKSFHKPLKEELLFGILFKVNEMVFVKDSTAEFFGEIIPVKIFRLKTKVRLFGDFYDMTGEIDSAEAYFNFMVGYDGNYKIHDKFVQTVYDYWKSKDALNVENFEPYPDYAMIYEDGDYILLESLKGYLQWSPFTIWYNKRIIKINSLIMDPNNFYNILSEDLMINLAFITGRGRHFTFTNNREFFPPDDFMRLFDCGKFKKRRWLDSFFEDYKNDF